MRKLVFAIVAIAILAFAAQVYAGPETPMGNDAWWDALKYGPIALAELVAFWTAALLTIELRQPNIRKDATRLLGIFMGFCLVLSAVVWAYRL
jgi:hypothetical protein